MPTTAELRRMRWSNGWTSALARRLVHRLLGGARGDALQPAWLPRRWVTVVSGDIDPDAGVAVVWLVSRPGHDRGSEYTMLFERCGEEWQCTGGGSSTGGGVDVPRARLAAGSTGQVGMIELGGGSCTLSYAYRLEHPGDPEHAPWVGSASLRAAAEVDHLVIGDRRFEVPASGELAFVWKVPTASASPIRGGPRPHIAAIGRDGSELSAIGPEDHMDSYTWARLSD